MTQPPFITHPDQLDQMITALKQADTIAVDTEFVRETTFFPQMALIQVATTDAIWLVDPLAFEERELDPLLDIFRDPKILKIMHAAFADQECFYWAFGEMAEPVLDTAVGAALLGLGDNIGLGKLTREVLNINLAKGRARAKWLKRPLSPELLHYAAQDVRYLVSLGQTLEGRLKKKDRWEWALEVGKVEEDSFNASPQQIAERLGRSTQVESSDYPVLLELVRWRETRARKADLPRNWVADNETLISLTKVKPGNIEELRSFRGLNGKEVDRSGNDILSAIRTGRESKVTAPFEKREGYVRAPEEAFVSFIQTYVDLLARDLEIAPRFLLTSPSAARLAQSWDGNIDQWIKDEILTPRAAALVGAELQCLVRGEHGLVVEKGRVKVKEFH